MGTVLKAVYMQSNELFVHRNLQQYAEGGVKTKILYNREILSTYFNRR